MFGVVLLSFRRDDSISSQVASVGSRAKSPAEGQEILLSISVLEIEDSSLSPNE